MEFTNSDLIISKVFKFRRLLIIYFLIFCFGCDYSSHVGPNEKFETNILGNYQGTVELTIKDSILFHYGVRFKEKYIAVLSNNESNLYTDFPQKGLICEIYIDSIKKRNLLVRGFSKKVYDCNINYYYDYETEFLTDSILYFAVVNKANTINLAIGFLLYGRKCTYAFVGIKE